MPIQRLTLDKDGLIDDPNGELVRFADVEPLIVNADEAEPEPQIDPPAPFSLPLDEPSVSELLGRSIRAHEQARGARRAKQKDETLAGVQEARTLRLQAHEKDPDHFDRAWQNDPQPHDELMKFYDQQIGRG